MKRTIKTALLVAVLSSLSVMAPAQSNRRAIVELATATVDKATTTGLRPGSETLSQLAAVADQSLDIVCRMADPADRRQSAACMRVVEAVADYALKPEGHDAIDKVRSGLRRAIERCDDAQRRQQLMTLMSKCGGKDDAVYLCQYLSDPQTQQMAVATLAAMPGIDSVIDSLISTSAKPDAQLIVVSKMRSGQLATKTPAANTLSAWKRPKKEPSWADTLNDVVDALRSKPSAVADSIIGAQEPIEALQSLRLLADSAADSERDAIVARYLHLAERADVNATERYLLLRAINPLTMADDLRRKLIIDFGTTQTVQALAAVRPFYDSKAFADAVALATVNVVKNNAEAVGGRHVRNMLIAAKQAFVRHYDEEGSGEAIDAIFDALDRCGNAGYDLSPSHTSMGKKGFWNMSDERADLAMTFDWKAEGALVVTLRSMPVLTLDRRQGARLAGQSEWHRYSHVSDWDTANLTLQDGRVTLSVNGQPLISDAPLVNPEQGQPVNATGCVAFTADEQGAVVEQVCIRK